MKPYHKNPRTITKKRLDRLADTLARLGDLGGIIHNLETDEIVGGNQRMRVFAEGAPSIVETYAEPDEQGTVAHGYIIWQGKKYSYRQVRWDEKTAEEANIAANVGAGAWDWDSLSSWNAGDLMQWGFDDDLFKEWKSDAGALGNLLESEKPPLLDAEPQLDRAEELQKVWQTATGQLWAIGDHRLAVGDCTDPATVERVMAREKADFMLTDPPYCSGGFQESGRSGGSVGTSAVHKKIESDTLSTRGYIALMKSMLSVSQVLAMYIFTDWRMWVNLFDAVESSGFGVRQMIVWDKGTPGMGHGWRSQHELIMFALKGTIPFDKFAHAQGNVIQGMRTGNELHTTEKPVELIEIVLSVMRDMKMVYDPFAGSGTTGIACQNLNRRARMIEISPAYAAVCLQRFADAFPGIEIERIE